MNQSRILWFLLYIFRWKASFGCRALSDMKYGPNCPRRNVSSPVSVELVIIVTGPNRKNFLWLAPEKINELVLKI